MLCKIADLYVELPEDGGLDKRCKEYLTTEKKEADIVITKDKYNPSRWPGLTGDNVVYMDSGWLFYAQLMLFGGTMLHSSAVELDGKAYLFSGPSGMGKSTHTRLWLDNFENARLFNDDKPALRQIDGIWYAYGTPWSGKDGININLKAQVAGICFLKRGKENKIRRLSPLEASAAILTQTLNRFSKGEHLDVLLAIIDKIIANVPVYELFCNISDDAVLTSYQFMSR
jgi:hypothetical protein